VQTCLCVCCQATACRNHLLLAMTGGMEVVAHSYTLLTVGRQVGRALRVKLSTLVSRCPRALNR